MMRRYAWGWVALLVAVAAIGWFTRDCGPRPIVVEPPTDTVDAAVYRNERDAARRQLELVRGERDGLAGVKDDLERQLRGLSMRQPTSRTVYDTTIVVDTVFLRATIRGGELSVVRALPVDSGLHQPEQLRGIDVGDCDDSIDITASGVICNRAVWGHATLLARGRFAVTPTWPPAAAGFEPELALRFTPSFRSTLAGEIAATRRPTCIDGECADEFVLELRGEVGWRWW